MKSANGLLRTEGILVAAVLLAACSTGSPEVAEPGQVAERAGEPSESEEGGSGDGARAEKGGGFALELRAVEPRAAEEESAGVSADELGPDATEEILSRLPPIDDGTSGPEAISSAPTSNAPPRPREVEMRPFPPSSEREPPAEGGREEGPLEVVRRSPRGAVEVAPRLSVTFSKPMIAVGETPEYRDYRSPIQIRPEIEGDWRWVGVRTLVFQPEDGRFPMASSYRAVVPADVESRSGARVGDTVSWRFQTPPLAVERFYPSEGPQPLDPVIALGFNQRVDREELVESVQIWGGGETYGPKLASRSRLDERDELADLLEGSPDGHWLGLRVPESLEPDTSYVVGIAEGAPSAEGPRRTEGGIYRRFRTRGRLEVEGVGCRTERCRPGESLEVRFSHGLDPDSVGDDAIEVRPALPERRVDVHGDKLLISGRSEGSTTYEIRVSPQIRGKFGQRLGRRVERSVEVGRAVPRVAGPGTWASLEPEGPRVVTVGSVNFEKLAVRGFRVEPSDWPEYLRALEDEAVDMPGKLSFEKMIAVDGESGEWTRTQVDVQEALGGDFGHAVVVARGVDPSAPLPERDWREARRVRTWVQSTDLAVDAFVDDREIVAWTTSLSDGEPVKGADIELAGAGVSAETGGDGLARVELPEEVEAPWNSSGGQLRAVKGDSTAFIPEFDVSGPVESRWSRAEDGESFRWYAFDDRNLYRPGERARIKGWVRAIRGGELAIPGEGREISYRAAGPRGEVFVEGRAELDQHGGFDVEIPVPSGANFGRSEIEFRLEGEDGSSTYRHSFRVRDFESPEFEVDVEAEGGPHTVGGAVEVAAEASYYAGGAVGNAETAWRVVARPENFAPPGREGFVFGEWQPWWRPRESGLEKVRRAEGRTDASGRDAVEVEFREMEPFRTRRVALRAAVTDVDRQTVAGRDAVLVHPGSVYVGLRTDHRFVGRDAPIAVEAIATAIDGTIESDRVVRLRAEAVEWTRRGGEWREQIEETKTCEVKSESEPVQCSFDPERAGVWRIRARVRDDAGRVAETRMRVWVAGDRPPSTRQVRRERLELVPRSSSWSPGETAEVLIRAPFPDGEGLATLQRDGVVETVPFSFEGSSHRLEIPIRESYMPGVDMRVDVVGMSPRLDADGAPVPRAPNRPGHASEEVELGVSTASKRLGVDVEPNADHVEPGSETSVRVRATESDGTVADDARVALAVVDEAVLAAGDYELPDPIGGFYPEVEPGVRARSFREKVVSTSNDRSEAGAPTGWPPAEVASGTSSSEASSAPGAEGAIELRRDFAALAHFQPGLPVGDDGLAEVTFDLPDSVGQFRVVAVAAQGSDRFGSGTGSFKTRRPVSLEPSMPRFLRLGDRSELPVVVHNRTRQLREVRLVGRGRNLSLEGSRGVSLDVPAGGRVEYRFSAETNEPGSAHVQFAAKSGEWTDGVAVDFPVRAPSEPEVFASHGTLDAGLAARGIRIPEEAMTSFGGLEVTTSSSALQELTDAWRYLVDFPHDYPEARASRVLGLEALREHSGMFDGAPGASDAELIELLREDLRGLEDLQMESGGFPMWAGAERSDPFVSVHAVHALAVGVESGFEKFRRPLRRGLEYLREIDERVSRDRSPNVRNTIRAYAEYVLQKAGAFRPDRAAKLAGGTIGEELSVEAAAWLLAALGANDSERRLQTSLRRQLENRVVEESGTAHVTTDYRGGSHLVMHSDGRTDALMLEALLRSSGSGPGPLARRFVQGLLENRVRGRWSNALENAFSLRAIERYYEERGGEHPDFAADLWIGESYLGRHEFRERTVSRRRVNVPVSVLRDRADDEEAPFRIRKVGDEGRLYYRMRLEFARLASSREAVERGFAIRRTFRSVDDSDEVERREDGSWRVEAGARVRVEVEMVAPSKRRHVALRDPLAAGVVPVRSSIATSESIRGDEEGSGSVSRGYGDWFDHQNLRSERAEAFARSVEAGVYSYTYVVRADVPGEFVVPPVRVEQLYHPETFGRGSPDRLQIVAP